MSLVNWESDVPFVKLGRPFKLAHRRRVWLFRWTFECESFLGLGARQEACFVKALVQLFSEVLLAWWYLRLEILQLGLTHIVPMVVVIGNPRVCFLSEWRFILQLWTSQVFLEESLKVLRTLGLGFQRRLVDQEGFLLRVRLRCDSAQAFNWLELLILLGGTQTPW